MGSVGSTAGLARLAEETCTQLGIRFPPGVLIVINRGVYARLTAHGLQSEESLPECLAALEQASAHVEATEERWARNSGAESGWWWDKVVSAYEMYFRALHAATGVMIAALERHGVAPPSPEELGLVAD